MKEKKFNLLHIIIAAIAIANLVILFVFQYGLSDTTPAVQAAQRASEERAAKSGSGSSSKAESDGEKNKAGEDVEASASSAEDTDTQSGNSGDKNETGIPSESESGSSANSTGAEKNPEDVTSSGIPSITLSEPLPAIDSGDLPNIVRVLSDLGYITADDGYGNDITDQVTADYEEFSSDSTEYRVTFSVTNRAGETATEVSSITVQAGTKPTLELTDDTIRLSVGANFYYMSYIKTARDVDGTSLDTRISISGVVDTSTRGTYELEYSTISRVTSERVSKTLTIIVE